MKKLYTIIALLIISPVVFSQPGSQPMNPVNSYSGNDIDYLNHDRNTVDSCGAWTGFYLQHKLTALEGYFIAGNTEYSGHAQYYSAPQPLQIRGVGFYGYAENTDSIPVVAELREASAVDSLPGTVLASDTIYVQQGTFQTNFLGQQYYEAFFNTPIVMNSGYNITVQNLTADTVVLYSNSYTNSDGNGEYLNSLYYSDPAFPASEGWYRSSAFGAAFDADFMILPILKTEIFEPYLIDPNDTICEGTNLCVEYFRKPIFNDHMYADQNFISMQSIDWTWGDGLSINGVDIACHMYDTTSTLTLTDTFYYYNAPNQQVLNCAIEESSLITVYKEPTVDFSYTMNGYTANFTNNSYNADNYSWDFGDGNTSTDVNPSHTYAGDSTYIIVLTASNQCFQDTIADTLVLEIASVFNNEKTDFVVYPNPATSQITVKSENIIGAELKLTDATGKIVKRTSIEKNEMIININDLSKGLYFISIDRDNFYKKIIIE